MRCCTRVENGPTACDVPTVTGEELQQATIKTINQIVQCSESMMQVLNGDIEEAHAKKDYGSLTDEINILREKKHEFLVRKAKTEG